MFELVAGAFSIRLSVSLFKVASEASEARRDSGSVSGAGSFGQAFSL